MDKALRFFGICIIIAAVCVSASILLSKYYKAEPAAFDRYKVVGNRVFDTVEGNYIDDKPIGEDISSVSIIENVFVKGNGPYSAGDFATTSSSFTKRLVMKLDRINFTIQNNDSVTHEVFILITYYDENGKAILTDNTISIKLYSDDIKKLSFTPALNSDQYKNYDAVLRPKEDSPTP